MYDYDKLYGKIREVFKTQEAFAEAMDMSRSALNLRLNGKVSWKAEEITMACELLGIPMSEAHLYFFELKVVKTLLC